MKQSMKGMWDVFSFTCSQTMKKKGYQLLTAGVALLLLVGIALVVIFVGKPDDKEEEPCEIEKVYVLNETEFESVDFASVLANDPYYAKIAFEVLEKQSAEDAFAYASEQTEEAVLAVVKKDGEGYCLSMIIASEDGASESEVEKLASAMLPAVQDAVYASVDLALEQIALLNMSVSVDCLEIGENNSLITTLINMIGPMLFGLMLYFILLAYGQMACKEVASEKTSKLMESMLTMVHPNALIAGKVLAVTVAALAQTFIWVICVIVGLVGGSYIADALYPDYQNIVPIILEFLRTNIGESAMTPASVIFAILIFCLGCLLFLVVAGMGGSIVSKPEELASANGVFVLPVIIGFFVGYFATLANNEKLLTICRYVPFTSPFTTPVELLTGRASIMEGAIGAGIMLVTSAILVFIAARLYRGLILYTGQKITLKTIFGVIRAK